jgi:hypothetical protein
MVTPGEPSAMQEGIEGKWEWALRPEYIHLSYVTTTIGYCHKNDTEKKSLSKINLLCTIHRLSGDQVERKFKI